MTDKRNEPMDQEALKKLFMMQPDNRLTPAQMVRKDLFPRWEMIQPAYYNPVDKENQLLNEILSAHQEHPEQ